MLKALLNQEGFRLTSQRQKILDLFKACSEGQHLSAEEIHQQLSYQGETISPSTVYRTIHVMVGLGLLRELELAEGRKYYELNAPFLNQHHHLVCVQCGAVTEFEENMMAQVGASQAEIRGYALLDCQFTIYGVCPNCYRA
ncbi:transcriptional repressor [Pseudanabaena sp. FACHB-2040]|nr:transcriptional repressor [Pseudanabaena sp. FACHB-2040]